MIVTIMTLFGVALAVCSFGLAATNHTRQPMKLKASLVQHQVLPYGWIAVTVRFILGLEWTVVLLASASALVQLRERQMLSSLLLAPAAFTLLGFAAYLWILVARGVTAPCGCFGGNGPTTWRTAAKTTVLGAAVLMGSLVPYLGLA